MDKEKSGKLIAALRKDKNMTQQDLAEQLHVTSKAVSKWERGLSFPSVDVLEPLAKALGISVLDILAGEIVENEKLPEKSNEISIQVLHKEKKTVRRAVWGCAISMVLAFVLVLQTWGPAIFQRGNPIPYLIASVQLSERPYVQVEERSENYVYITKIGDSEALFDYIESSRNVTFVEQAGSGYIFTTGTENFVVSSEIFWGRFTVWTMSSRTLSYK